MNLAAEPTDAADGALKRLGAILPNIGNPFRESGGPDPERRKPLGQGRRLADPPQASSGAA